MPRERSPSPRMALERQRRQVGWALVAAFWLAAFWLFSPGLPVLIGPWAMASTKEAGRELFEHEWTPNDPLAHGDGLGPVFNAKSCAACHSQGGIGGGGDNSHNIRNFAVLPTRRDAELHEGTVHHFAVANNLRESFEAVHIKHPVIKGETRTRNEGHCTYQVVIPDFDPVRPSVIQATALFGAGWIDRISTKAIAHSLMSQAVGNVAKEFQLDFGGVPAGHIRTLPDGRIGKFGWKAQFATLEEFVAAACANELGLGTPLTEQARPFGKSDTAATKPDLDKKQFAALVAFVDTLPCPVEVTPGDPAEARRAARGKELFTGIGCAACHVPDMGGVKGVYSDFLLHRIDEPGRGGRGGSYDDPPPDVPMPPDRPPDSEWKTPPLWGVADSAPYLHDGSAPTLRDAILRHKSDAKIVTDAFTKLSKDDQQALVSFLMTLKAPSAALQVAKK